jgi:hypothetical protein
MRPDFQKKVVLNIGVCHPTTVSVQYLTIKTLRNNSVFLANPKFLKSNYGRIVEP